VGRRRATAATPAAAVAPAAPAAARAAVDARIVVVYVACSLVLEYLASFCPLFRKSN
jgi:hypothetical protein